MKLLQLLFPICTILSLNLFSSEINVLHNFNGTNGADPKGSLNRAGDILYGRTTFGGAHDKGTIFRLGIDGSNYQPLYSFLNGANNGTGNQPHHTAMFFLGSTLFGNATFGGSNDEGAIYSIEPDGSNYQVIHLFTGSPLDGNQPKSNVIFFDSNLYGMTALGGLNNVGSIYKVQPNGSNFQLLHSFQHPTGSNAHGELTLSSNANILFGMTRGGGTSGGGVIFALSNFNSIPSYSVLHNFGSFPGDGYNSDHGYLTKIGNNLYGMTTNGGNNPGLSGDGVIFSIEESGLNYKILHTFGTQLNDALNPLGSLTASKYNIMYGLSRNGGEHNLGTIFQILPDGTFYKVLASFDGANGAFPIDNVIISDDGLTLYGLANRGGAFDPNLNKSYGTIFSFRLPLSSFPPNIQNLFQIDSELVAMRSLTSMGAQALIRQEAALIERQSNFRSACFARNPPQWSNACKPNCTTLETFQRELNFNLVGSYQTARFFPSSGIAGFETQSAGAVLMSDVLLGRTVFLGEAIGYVDGKGKFDQQLGKNDVQSVIGSIYSTFLYEHFYADIIGSFAWNFYDLQRNIALWNLTATSRPQGYLGALDLTLGYYIDAGPIAFTPMAGFYYARSHINQFKEKGAEDLNLRISSFHLDSLHSMLGLRVGSTFSVGCMQFLPEIEVGWEYELINQGHSIQSRLIHSDFLFDLFLPEFNRQFFTCGANLTAFFSSNCFLEFSYVGEYSHRNLRAHTFNGNLAFSF